MELRLLLIAMRILDPRLWRRRLAQLGGGVLLTLWVWVRSVQRGPIERALADERHVARERRIRAELARVEAARLEG